MAFVAKNKGDEVSVGRFRCSLTSIRPEEKLRRR